MNILSVQFETNIIPEIKKFYKSIGFRVREIDDKLIINVQHSEIVFKRNEALMNESFYHFAIDIPPLQYNRIKASIKDKIELLIEEDNDEIYFEHIDARSFYINDPAGNIVEFVARNDLDNKYIEVVNVDYLRISEISLVTNKVIETFNQLKMYGFRERDNEILENGLNFICSGIEKSYILLTKENRRWLFSDRLSKSFPIKIITNEYILNYKDDKLDITRIN
ncbi:hypothetical protein GTN30_01860 [Macrococcoides canis]|uniref:Toxoflavin-degrading enzyme domain-containing protein n=1 Tax=Macrococcoides canis TaxID=1855823 RepID=A0A6G5ZZI7_9STAP|nr:hypothetical protein [Macrococcus canis]QHW12334.1 hypothetical protein 0076A_00047 [Macrococcus canis]QIH77412.1 hypothetical protein GTN30_01860 [Macrococcus canis]